MKITDVVEGWLLTKAAETRPLTPKTCKMRVAKFVQWLGTSEQAEPDVDVITPAMLREYVVFLRSERTVLGEPMSPAYINTLYGTVRDLLRWCYREEIIGKDVTEHIKPPKFAKKHKEVFTKEEISTLLSACNARDKLIIQTFLDTAMRLHELTQLRICDINFTSSTLHIREGKGGAERMAYMSKKLSARLWSSIKGRLDDKKSPLFLKEDGDGINDNTVHMLCVRLSEKTGIHVNPHKFRHTAITMLFEAGLSMEVVRNISGHTNYVVLQDYAHMRGSVITDQLDKYSPLKNT